MHTMPGLPILHSRDLVTRKNGYAFDRLGEAPDFRLEDGKQIYGQARVGPPVSATTKEPSTVSPT